MRIVVDTNVVVSAIVWGGTPSEVLLFLVEHADAEWVVTEEIIEEYVGVLRRPKFKLPVPILAHWERFFAEELIRVSGEVSVVFPRDQTDAKFLICALLADADFFVTGDRDFESIQKFGQTTIISATQFKLLVIDTDTNLSVPKGE